MGLSATQQCVVLRCKVQKISELLNHFNLTLLEGSMYHELNFTIFGKIRVIFIWVVFFGSKRPYNRVFMTTTNVLRRNKYLKVLLFPPHTNQNVTSN